MSEEKCYWYVVRAQPKRERVAARSLRATMGLEVVCPLVKFLKETRRGRVWWSEAMFPGYLFAKFNRKEDERGVRYARGVLTIVKFGKSMPVVPDVFVDSVTELLGEQEEVVIAHDVEVGAKFELAEGPLSGQIGDVMEVLPGKERVRLLVEFIGGAREVEVDLMSLLLPGRPDLKR
ncbi:MAG: transcription termination/antitermination NusG family protein [Rubritalea sp.]|uniref:transcription termination/antitermination protein NusG n=1 Tax=Rubritalea sp. TaxID=2109375 RepID=UPI003241E10C